MSFQFSSICPSEPGCLPQATESHTQFAKQLFIRADIHLQSAQVALQGWTQLRVKTPSFCQESGCYQKSICQGINSQKKEKEAGGERDMPKSSWQKVERKLKLRGVKVTLQFARLTCPRAALTSLPKGRGACRLYGPELPSDLS